MHVINELCYFSSRGIQYLWCGSSPYASLADCFLGEFICLICISMCMRMQTWISSNIFAYLTIFICLHLLIILLSFFPASVPGVLVGGLLWSVSAVTSVGRF